MTEKTGNTESGNPDSNETNTGNTKSGGTHSASSEPQSTQTKVSESKSERNKSAKTKSKSSNLKSGKGGSKNQTAKAGRGQSTDSTDKLPKSADGSVVESAGSVRTESGSTAQTDRDPGTIDCPVCTTELRSWQINCHGCGQSISSFEIQIIQGDATIESDLMQAFQKWMRRGKLAFKNESYDEAHACFAEALKRVHGLDSQKEAEIKARQKLADAFVKLNKVKEAVEQLVRASHLSEDEEQKQTFEKRIDYLNRKAESTDSKTASFRPPRDVELMSAPLYCIQCHRLLSEREVYRFRSSKQSSVKCVCGFDGLPVTPESTAVPIEPLPLGPPLGIKKAKLIEAAQKPVQGGRDRKVAIWLAVVLGNFGVHKFYLGEKALGILYLALCWTTVPWLISLYEAVHIAQMSRVSFNLVYNIEEIVRRLPDDVEGEGDADVFNMEVSEDPEDLVDTWSQGDEFVIPTT